jgi:type III secretion protein C
VRIFRGGQHDEVADDLTGKDRRTAANSNTNDTSAGE